MENGEQKNKVGDNWRASDEIPVESYSNQEALFIRTPDDRLVLHVEPEVLVESKSFFGPDRPSVDGFQIRGGLQFSARAFEMFQLRIWPFFNGSELTLHDFYGAFEPDPAFRLQFGYFREPVSYERTQSFFFVPFFNRSLVRNLAPARDVGLQISGAWFGQTLSYAIFLGNGVLDGRNSTTNTGAGLDGAARLSAQPFRTRTGSLFEHLGLGGGSSFGPRDDLLNEVSYTAAGGTRFLQYAQGARATNTQFRLAPFLFWTAGPVGLRGEYLLSDQTVSDDGRSARAHNQAWYVEAKVVLTGEPASTAGIEPKGGFAPFQGHLGAYLLAVRYSELRIDEDVFAEKLVEANHSASRARDFAASVEGYVSPKSKVQISYSFTRLAGQGGEAGVSESALFIRLQLIW